MKIFCQLLKNGFIPIKIFLFRELVSNACDAIYKVKLLRDQKETDAKDEEFRIDIAIDKEQKTIKFIDTGIGMDEEEIVKYIAQIAFSGAEDFVSKYQGNQEKDQFIGHFGLGFYSAYMVAEKVEINTLSYKAGAKAGLLDLRRLQRIPSGRGNKRNTAAPRSRSISAPTARSFSKKHRLKEILSKYCSFLPYPDLFGRRENQRHRPSLD